MKKGRKIYLPSDIDTDKATYKASKCEVTKLDDETLHNLRSQNSKVNKPMRFR